MGVLYVEHANVLELCYIELLSGDGSPYSLLSDLLSMTVKEISLFPTLPRAKSSSRSFQHMFVEKMSTVVMYFSCTRGMIS